MADDVYTVTDDEPQAQPPKKKRKPAEEVYHVTDEETPYTVSDSTPLVLPTHPTPPPAAPKPAPRRGVFAGIGDAIGSALGEAKKNLRPTGYSNRPSAAGMVRDESTYGHDATRSIEQAPDRRTPEQVAQDADRAMRGQIAQRPDVSGTKGASLQRGTRPGETQTVAAAENRALQVERTQHGAEASNFDATAWQTVAARGRELAAKLRAEGDSARADDIDRKARNADLLAESNQKADTFEAIALSNLLGIVKDPYAAHRRNIAQAAAPDATFSPEETASLTGGDRMAAARGGDVTKDFVAPLVGGLPVYVAGGVAGRAAAAGAGAFAEARGATSIGQALGRLAGVGEETAAIAGPSVPVRTLPLAKARVAEEIAQFRAAAPGMVARGASEGQVIGAVQAYQMARQQGASKEEAFAAAAEGVPLNMMMGVAAELGISLAGRAAGAGFDPVGRVLTDLTQGRGLEGRRIDRPLDRRGIAEQREVGQQRAVIADALTQLLDQRVGEDTAARRELVAPGEAYDFRRPVEEPNSVLPSAREAGLRRAGVEETASPRPTDSFNAVEQMRRQREAERAQLDAEASDPTLQLERAAQERPSEVQGPRTLGETLADTKAAAAEGEPLAAGYHDAINTYVDALAAVKDAGEKGPSTKTQVALVRARQALNAAREQYGKQLGASAVLALAANNDDLTDDEKAMVGLAGVALSTSVVKHVAPEERARVSSLIREATRGLSAENQAVRMPVSEWLDRLHEHHGEITTDVRSALAGLDTKYPAGLTGEHLARIVESGTDEVARDPLYSRLRVAVQDPQQFPKKWDEPRPAADWIGKLKGSSTFSKKELALLMPDLEAAQTQKLKLGRAEVLNLIEQRVPRIERVTLADVKSKGRAVNPEAGITVEGHADRVMDIDDMETEHNNGRLDPADFERQIANRRARIDEIETEVQEAVDAAARDMDEASNQQGRRLRELRDTLHDAGQDRAASDAAVDYINEHVEGDEFLGDLDHAAALVMEDVNIDDDPEALLASDYTVDEETLTPEPKRWMELRDESGQHILVPSTRKKEWGWTTNKTKEEYRAEAERRYPGSTLTFHEEAVEPYEAWTVRRDRDGKLIAEGDDRDDVMREAVNDEELAADRDSLYHDIRRDLSDYVDASIEYARAESEHYQLDNEPEYGRFSDELEEKERLETEIPRIGDWLTEAREREHNDPVLQLARGEAPRRPEPEVEVSAAPVDEEPVIEPPVKGPAKYATYQRIGGGRNYRELPSVVENHPGEAYDRNHYASSAGLKNVGGHLRAEEHAVHETPGLTGPTVEYVKGEPENERVLRSQIGEVRSRRAQKLKVAADIATEFEHLPPIEQEERQGEYMSRYSDAHQHVVDLGLQEDKLAAELRDKLGARDEMSEMDQAGRTVHVMIESQMDWAQDATKLGVHDPAREAEARAEVERARAAYDAADKEYTEQGFGDHDIRDPAFAGKRGQLYNKLQEAQLALGDAQDHLATAKSGVSASPFTDTATAASLNAARFLLDVAERGGSDLAWSDSGNRIANASLPPKAAKLVYDELTPSAMKRLLGGLGFKDITIDKMFIKGEGHWHLALTPEMRKAIKRVGLPIMGVLALTPDTAEAQTGTSAADLYTTALGGLAAGAALMYVAGNRKARRLVHENRELARALSMDDLSGLANKRAFLRAKDGVDADEKFGWVVADGDRFKAMNDTHGHPEGDKAIAHFGETMRNAAVELGIPLRAFRVGGDEFAYAVPKEQQAALARYLEQHSEYTKGEVTTKLSTGMGDSFEEADAALVALKEGRRKANPALRREGASPEGGATLYANPIGPALKAIAKYPSAAGIAALGVALGESDDEDLKHTSPFVIGLAALSAIGSAPLIAGKDKLVEATVAMMKSMGGEKVVRFFNPDRLLDPSVLDAISAYEAARARGTARAAEFSKKSADLGPAGDRAVSDVIENEAWEDTTQFSPDQLKNILAVAAAIDAEYQATAQAQLASGARSPEELLDVYGGPRRYAAYEAEAVQQDRPGYVPPRSKRIGATKHRTLDEPIRDAERRLQEATATGDPATIQTAQDALDEAYAVQMSQRTQLGEIREQSYRAAQGIEAGHANAAAADLFTAIRNIPGSVHPEWEAAITDLDAAKQLKAAATTPADRDAAQQLINQATVDLDGVTRRFKRKDADYVALPDSKGLGMLRGAVVKRDIAHSLTGFSDEGMYKKLLRQWKELKTVFNVGTHIANVVSNFSFAHMEGLLLHEQPVYLKRAFLDMKKYGAATRALAEAGILDHNVVTADGSGPAGRDMRSVEGLEALRQTTTPDTRAVLEDRGITASSARKRSAVARAKGAAGGAALGAAALVTADNPEDAALGAGIGAGVGAAMAGRGKGVRKLYNNEDNIFRVAIYLKKIESGMSPDDALRYSRGAMGHFRTRSPALNLVRTTVSPFVLYPAKAVPRFARQMIDHPWRYMALIAAWGGLNELAEADVGEVPDSDLAIKDRTQTKWGYFFPGFTQLPTTNERGERGATDMSRWTPMSGVSTGAPPGSVVGTLSEDLPAVLQPSGPALDAAAKLYGNVDVQTGKPRYKRDYPAKENIAKLLNDASDLALPPALGFHRARMQEDVANRDFDKLRTDALGPTGLRPRFVRPGANVASALHQLQSSLSDMKFELKTDLRDNRNPERVPTLVDRYLRRRKQAIENFTRRTGSPPPADAVPPDDGDVSP